MFAGMVFLKAAEGHSQDSFEINFAGCASRCISECCMCVARLKPYQAMTMMASCCNFFGHRAMYKTRMKCNCLELGVLKTATLVS